MIQLICEWLKKRKKNNNNNDDDLMKMMMIFKFRGLMYFFYCVGMIWLKVNVLGEKN